MMKACYALALAAVLVAGACASRVRQPDWVQWVPEPPPPDRAEIHGPRPAPGDAWVRGYWKWTDTGWQWEKGAFVTAPAPDVIWIPGVWVEAGGQWAYAPGSWRRVSAGQP